jgi:hypothetical protein
MLSDLHLNKQGFSLRLFPSLISSPGAARGKYKSIQSLEPFYQSVQRIDHDLDHIKKKYNYRGLLWYFVVMTYVPEMVHRYCIETAR